MRVLQAEADDRFEQLPRRLSNSTNFWNDDHALRTKRRLWTAPAGHRLIEAHRGELRDLVSGLVDEELAETRASYVRYASGDYLGPHHDTYSCDLTLVVPLSPCGQLVTYDVDDQAHADEIYDGFVRDRLPELDVVSYELGSAYLVAGRRIAHGRRATTVGETAALLCYGLADRI